MIHKPTFFIVGAPRSGTTSLYEYLKAHPEIYVAPYKEPHFFATDLKPVNPWLARLRQKKHYLALFEQVKNEKQIGTASVLYLFSKKAAKNIYKFNPNTKIIIMLRSPIEVMHSLYYQLYYGGDENIATFREALLAETARKQGRRLPKTFLIMKEFYYYKEIAKFSEQVKRYFDTFKKEQILVIIFEDFKKDPLGVCRRVFEFLKVDPNFVPKLKVANPNQRLISPFFRLVLYKFTKPLNILGPKAFLALRPIYKRLERLILKPVVRPAIDPKLEEELKQEFLPEVKKLSKIISYDVSYWCE